MRVLVCGGRDYRRQVEVYWQLDKINRDHGVSAVITGGATGADEFGFYWGSKHTPVDNLQFKADWAKYGRKAGPIRNQRMLDEGRPDVVLAFPGGHGTEDMVRRAEAAGIKIIRVTDGHTEAASRNCGRKERTNG